MKTAQEMRERFGPAADGWEEQARQARRVMVQGRHAAEDAVAEAALRVRRHPVAAVSVAAGAGVVVGCMFGFAIGWRSHRV